MVCCLLIIPFVVIIHSSYERELLACKLAEIISEQLREQGDSEVEQKAFFLGHLANFAKTLPSLSIPKKAEHVSMNQEGEEIEAMRMVIEEKDRALKRQADLALKKEQDMKNLLTDLKKKDYELESTKAALAREREERKAKRKAKKLFSEEEGEWEKTPLLPKGSFICRGLVLTPTHAVAVLKDSWVRKDNAKFYRINVAFSSSPSTGPWTLNTIETVSDDKAYGMGGIAVGNGFCVIAGDADFKDKPPFYARSICVFFSPSTSLGGEWIKKTIISDPETECSCNGVVFAGEYFFVIGWGVLNPGDDQQQSILFYTKDPREEWKRLGIGEDTGSEEKHNRKATRIHDVTYVDGEYVAVLERREELDEDEWTYSLLLIHSTDPALFSPSLPTVTVKTGEGSILLLSRFAHGNDQFVIAANFEKAQRVFFSSCLSESWNEAELPQDFPSEVFSLCFAKGVFYVSGTTRDHKPIIAASSSPFSEWRVAEVDEENGSSFFSLFSSKEESLLGVLNQTDVKEENPPIVFSRQIHFHPSPRRTGLKIHLLLEEAANQQPDIGLTAGLKFPKEDCNRLFARILSQHRLIQNVQFFKNLANSLTDGDPDEEARLLIYFQEITIEGEQLFRSTNGVPSTPFLLLLAWCLTFATENSQLEAFILNTLLDKTQSLTPEEKILLRLPLKQSLTKVPISSAVKPGTVNTEREGIILFLFLRTFDTSAARKFLSTPHELPLMADDHFPSIVDLKYAVYLGDYCLEKRRKGGGEGKEEKKIVQILSEVEGLIQAFVCCLHVLLSRWQPQHADSWFSRLCQDYPSGGPSERMEQFIQNLLPFFGDRLNRAKDMVASHSLLHLLFFFRQPLTLHTPSWPATPFNICFLPFSFLTLLLLRILDSFSVSLKHTIHSKCFAIFRHLLKVGLIGLRELARAGGEESRGGGEEDEKGRSENWGREGGERELKEEERVMVLERGGYSLLLLLDQAEALPFRILLKFHSPFFSFLSRFLHVRHSLSHTSSTPPYLQAVIERSVKTDPDCHFDPTHPLLLPEQARLRILSLFSSFFSTSKVFPLSFLSSLMKDGVLKRMGCVMDGRGEVIDKVRAQVTGLFGEVAHTALLNTKKLPDPLTEQQRMNEKATEEERREFVSLSQDALEEEGAEDSLLLLSGVEVKREKQGMLKDASSNSQTGLAVLGIALTSLEEDAPTITSSDSDKEESQKESEPLSKEEENKEKEDSDWAQFE